MTSFTTICRVSRQESSIARRVNGKSNADTYLPVRSESTVDHSHQCRRWGQTLEWVTAPLAIAGLAAAAVYFYFHVYCCLARLVQVSPDQLMHGLY